MRLKSIFQRRELWSIGIYKLKSRNDLLSLESHEPLYFVGEKGLRKSRDYQCLVADPFLFSTDGTLYLFYEVQIDRGRGEIWAKSLSENGEWLDLGKVLSENFHLSYPQVFEHDGQIYMLPEAGQSGSVLLYKAVNFPLTWALSDTLVSEPLLDPTLFATHDAGFMLLATTRDYELKLYHSSIFNGPFVDSGITISKDKAISRGAGSIVRIGSEYFRPAQDCSKGYGQRIQLFQITECSSRGYVEAMAVPDMFSVKPSWMSEGSHHLSCSEHDGSLYVAVDGRKKDRYINTVLFGLILLRDLFFK